MKISTSKDGQPQFHPHKTQNTSETAAVRSKLTSMWHSVKYGKAAFAAVSAANNDQNFDRNSAVWLLGQCYLKRRRSSDQSNGTNDRDDDAIQEFALDFASKIWMTYRYSDNQVT